MRWSEEVSVPTKNTKIHKVVILVSSGSMQGDKYDSARKGIELDYQACKKDGFIDYRLVEFSIQVRSNLYEFTRNLEFKPQFWGTALYSTIYSTLNGILSNIPTEDKVLIQIFTDGQDTDSSEYRVKAKEVIEQCNSKGWTVTFVGTEHDVAFVQRNLSIADSNTLVHDNSARGIKMSFESYMDNQTTYSKNVSKGIDVTTGFFKDIKNTTNG